MDMINGLNTIKETKFDAVVHLAAKAGVRPSIADPEGYIKVNIGGTKRILSINPCNPGCGYNICRYNQSRTITKLPSNYRTCFRNY